MKFICTSELNDLYAAFEKDSCHRQDFQAFVEEGRGTTESLCLDTSGIEGFLEKVRDEDYDYLLECDDEDLQFYGGDYLKRINFLSRLLGETVKLTIQDIQQDRRSCSGADVNGVTDTLFDTGQADQSSCRQNHSVDAFGRDKAERNS